MAMIHFTAWEVFSAPHGPHPPVNETDGVNKRVLTPPKASVIGSYAAVPIKPHTQVDPTPNQSP